jgi:hypothetical protein
MPAPANFATANDRRSADAAGRDTPLARQIAASAAAMALLDDTQRRVVAARAARPDATWSQIGDGLGMSKDRAYHTWQRALRRRGVEELTT